MAEWSDPRIVVAIAVGALGVLTGGGSLGFSIWVFRRHRFQRRQQAQWEEYRETVYDPLISAVKDVETLAKRCVRISSSLPSEAEWSRVCNELGEAMNEMEIECGRCDQHEATIVRDWVTQAEEKSEQLYSQIGRYQVGNATSSENGSDLQGIAECLRECVQFFEHRLLAQRKALLDF